MREEASVLVINPGATSTKIAWFEGEREVFSKTLRHTDEELNRYPRVADQRQFRVECVVSAIRGAGRRLEEVGVLAARGGLLPGLEGGTYLVDEAMVAYLEKAPRGEHASNLGAPMAFDLAKQAGVDAYVTDPVSVDEMEPEARLSGYPPVERVSLFHALNIRAVARRHAQSLGKDLADLNLVVCHLGTGVSVALGVGVDVGVGAGLASSPAWPAAVGIAVGTVEAGALQASTANSRNMPARNNGWFFFIFILDLLSDVRYAAS